MPPHEPTREIPTWLNILRVAAIAAIVAVVFREDLKELSLWLWAVPVSGFLHSIVMSSPSAVSKAAPRAPVYFFSHGGVGFSA